MAAGIVAFTQIECGSVQGWLVPRTIVPIGAASGVVVPASLPAVTLLVLPHPPASAAESSRAETVNGAAHPTRRPMLLSWRCFPVPSCPIMVISFLSLEQGPHRRTTEILE